MTNERLNQLTPKLLKLNKVKNAIALINFVIGIYIFPLLIVILGFVYVYDYKETTGIVIYIALWFGLIHWIVYLIGSFVNGAYNKVAREVKEICLNAYKEEKENAKEDKNELSATKEHE